MATNVTLMNADWNEVLSNVNPYLLGNLGAAFALTFCVLGAGWGIFLTGATIIGAAIKAPRIGSKNLISVIFCEATAIYGVILAIILSNKVAMAKGAHGGALPSDFDQAKWMFAGYGVFFSGLSVGLSNLASGVAIGVAGSSCALADTQDATLFVTILLVEVFASALGIFGVILSVLMATNANFPE